MNRLILDPTDFIAEDLAIIGGARAEHLIGICKLGVGDPVKVGIINGSFGVGEVVGALSDSLKIRFYPKSDSASIQEGEVTVLLAMPRPQMLKRIFQKAATFGVKRLILFRSHRVEKSYFDSPLLLPNEVRRNLILGLEQGGKTRLPEIIVHKHQREFSAWRNSQSFSNTYILSLRSKNSILDYPEVDLTDSTFLIGPEGGFLQSEEELFISERFIPIKVADSILRVESAFDFILAQHTLTTMRRKKHE